MKALIVCTGNTCRSPMLEAMLKKALADRGIRGVEVQSAGTMEHQKPISMHTTAELDAHGVEYDSSRLSRFCSRKLFDEADSVFTMTKEQADFLSRLYGDERKIIPLSAFYGEDIPDPYGGGPAAYSAVYSIFEGLLDKLVAYIANLNGGN